MTVTFTTCGDIISEQITTSGGVVIGSFITTTGDLILTNENSKDIECYISSTSACNITAGKVSEGTITSNSSLSYCTIDCRLPNEIDININSTSSCNIIATTFVSSKDIQIDITSTSSCSILADNNIPSLFWGITYDGAYFNDTIDIKGRHIFAGIAQP